MVYDLSSIHHRDTNIQNTMISSNKYDTGNHAMDTMSITFEEITKGLNFLYSSFKSGWDSFIVAMT